MSAGKNPPNEPDMTKTGSGLAEPIYLPALRRPVGWRELDSPALLMRVRGLFAAQCLAIEWPNTGASELMDIQQSNPNPAILTEKSQLSSSDHALGQEWLRIQALVENAQFERQAEREQPTKEPRRFSGWVLTASLIMVALQFALFWVAISPLKVIENIQQSTRQWQLKQQITGASMSEPTSMGSSNSPTEKANWWTSWQQTSMTGLFSNSRQEPSDNVQRNQQSNEVTK